MKEPINLNGTDYYTIQGAADLLEMRYNSLFRHLDGLDTIKIGAKTFITKVDVDKYLEMREFKKKINVK